METIVHGVDEDLDYNSEEIDEEIAEEPHPLANWNNWSEQPFDPSTWMPSSEAEAEEKFENAKRELGYWAESVEGQEWAKEAMGLGYAEIYGTEWTGW